MISSKAQSLSSYLANRRTDPSGANAALQLISKPSHLMTDFPSSTDRLTTIRTPEVRSAGNQSSNLVIKKQCDRSRSGYGDLTAQKPTHCERSCPTSSTMALPSQTLGRADSLGEESEALLPKDDLEENQDQHPH